MGMVYQPTTERPEREIVITRTFEAPAELVYKCWTEAEHMAKWWGPHMFSNPVCEIDARVGGKIVIQMKGPDGSVFPMVGDFSELTEFTKIAFNFSAQDMEGNRLLEGFTSVALAEENGKTILTVHSKAVGLVDIAPQMLAGMEMGWTQSLERLEELVSTGAVKQ